ncbi:hypothetical protein DZF91_26850, partial [Actinomadura logoneensis]
MKSIKNVKDVKDAKGVRSAGKAAGAVRGGAAAVAGSAAGSAKNAAGSAAHATGTVGRGVKKGVGTAAHQLTVLPSLAVRLAHLPNFKRVAGAAGAVTAGVVSV